MSYTDERDELAEFFGAKPIKRRSGYTEDSDELKQPVSVASSAPSLPALVRSEAPPRPGPAEPSGTALPVEKPPILEVKTPVKLRPPAHVEPHPLDLPPSRHAVAQPAPVPAQAVVRPQSTHIVEDEEFLHYDSSGMPDFSDLELMPLEEIAAPAPKARATPAPAADRPKPAVPPSDPRAKTTGDKAAAPPGPPGADTTSDLQFTSEDRPAQANQANLLLDTHGLVKIYDGRTVVNGVDINVRPGEIVGLLGPNGAGKTTSFYMIVGLVPPNGGQVLFNGNDVTSMPMYLRARLGMGYLPQEESIFRKLTVEENIMAVMETLNISRKERLERCQELLERFSITHIRKNVALTCSGGEKRRLTIARSLVTTPSLLMLDEPFSGVDPIAVNEIQNIVEDLRKSGIAILITDHNARQTLELVDRAYLIYEGRVLREGTRDFLINDPVSRELYLGDRFTM
ncbi:MAG TPA: LPS export ABC transporter ATP-binding protein [Verrucomicrobiales bacterium]|nr:LPS export ABC transporter ATP-binding protein [Verrucomicrobiales bacterium]